MSALTIDDLRSAVAEGSKTATALAGDFYTRIRQEDPEIGAFLTLCEERALAQAGRIDAMVAEGKPLPPLAGVPVAIKDVMVTKGVRTTAGSKNLDNFIPPYDCTAVARLEAAGPGVFGKHDSDEVCLVACHPEHGHPDRHKPRAQNP